MAFPEQNLHAGQPVLQMGAALEQARAAMILIHGRGASADDILVLAEELKQPGWVYLAPQAAGNTWYPQRFMEPIATNEPWLSSALNIVDGLLAKVQGAGLALEQVILLGFSQGACLTLEYAARHAQRYGGVVGYSGGLIGPDDTPRDYPGTLSGTPVFLGCSDRDPHIPAARVLESAEVLRRLGGAVTARLYPGMGHTVNAEELDFVRQLMKAVMK